MDLLVAVHRRTSGLLRDLMADGALPPDLELDRFSVRVAASRARGPRGGVDRAGDRGDLLVDAALVYGRDAAAAGSRPLADFLAAGLLACPEVAAVRIVGGGLIAVALRPAAVHAAVSAVLCAAESQIRPGRPGDLAARPGAPRRAAAGTGAALARARADATADILAALARAAGLTPAAVPRAPPADPASLDEGRAGGSGSGGGVDLAMVGEDSFRFAVASRRAGDALDLSGLGDRCRADPAFWVCYAHARARAVLRRAAAALPDIDLSPAALAAADLSRLTDAGEAALARLVALHGGVVAGAAAAAAPQSLAAHLVTVAEAVHSQWSRSKDQPQLRFVNEEQRDLTEARLALMTASALVLRSGLHIIGIAAPDEMR